MAPSRARHGAIQSEAGRLIGNHLLDHPRCRTVTDAGVSPDAFNFRIPDLAVTCEQLGPNDIGLREPMLIVEVLSPTNARDTWAAVTRYLTIASVREVLVLHGAEQKAELLRRQDTGWLRLTFAPGDDVTLESIGLTVTLAAFYRTA
jgi:Uma2 family endonuclease